MRKSVKRTILLLLVCISSLVASAQINTDRVMIIGRNALFFEDYILAIQYFNQVIKAKPYLAEPYYYRAVAKYYLDDTQGTEEDCSLALERNPFLVRAYQLRSDARQSLENFDGAIADADKVLEDYPQDQFSLIIKGLSYTQKKEYEKAEETLDNLLKIYPKYTQGYLVRAGMNQERGDTIQAFKDYDEAIKVDKYLPNSYAARGMLYYNTFEYDKALADYDEAIKLDPLQGGYYINRGMIKYSKNDLRGAMADYDKVIDLEPNNVIARFNRGLLRSQVGDDNRAVKDFDVVIEQEPTNQMAYINRALIKSNIGNYKGAIADINTVLAEQPEFYVGFQIRSDIKRKMGDLKGSERDYNYALKEEERIRKELIAGNIKEDEFEKTRELSDKDLDKFNRLVVADKTEQEKSKYDSKSRGRIQNKQIQIRPESRFVITYYEKPNDVKRFVYFSKLVDDLNKQNVLLKKLRITNSESPLSESQAQEHFRSIDELSRWIGESGDSKLYYFARALDYTLVQDFSSAIEDYKKVIELDPDFTLAYFNLATVYAKQLESKESNAEQDKVNDGKAQMEALGATKQEKNNISTIDINPEKMEYDQIVKCYEKVNQLAPELVYAYYNRAEIRFKQQDYRAAILDYNEAIRRDGEFAEAYYNRGLARFYLGDRTRAMEDMRKAGELGIVEAYSIMKRMSE